MHWESVTKPKVAKQMSYLSRPGEAKGSSD